MRGRGDGPIIFIGATSAIRHPGDGLACERATFAVRGMAETMARELGPDGIHVDQDRSSWTLELAVRRHGEEW